MTPNPDIVDRFKDDLLAASATRPGGVRRRRWVIAVAGMACAAAVAIVAALPAANDGNEALRPGQALAVSRGEDSVNIRIADASASPERIERELRALGISASVEAVPVSPSLVGTWTTVSATPPLRDDASEHAQVGHGVDLNVPRDYDGELKLRIGRPPRPGEQLRMSASAFSPGEKLHCSSVEQLSGERAAAEIARHGLVPRWEHLQMQRVVETQRGKPDRTVEAIFPVLVDAPPPGRIIDARLVSRGYPPDYGRADGRNLLVTVAPNDIDLPPGTVRIPPQRCD